MTQCIDLGRIVASVLPPPANIGDPTGPAVRVPVPLGGVWEISVDGDALVVEEGTDPQSSGMLVNVFAPRRVRIVAGLAACALGGSSTVRITLAPVVESR